MSLHDGHRARMRTRLLKERLDQLEPHQALEVLLYYTNARKDTNELAHELLDRFGSFSAVLDASYEELCRVPGVGESTATFLRILPQSFNLYMRSKEEARPVLDSTDAAGRFFIPYFIGLTQEELHMACLDDKRQLICSVKISEGSVNSTAVSVRRVISEALSSNATGVILAHNHPGGLALPSSNDRTATFQIHKALQQINIQLLDHLVVYHTDYVSMAESGDFIPL